MFHVIEQSFFICSLHCNLSYNAYFIDISRMEKGQSGHVSNALLSFTLCDEKKAGSLTDSLHNLYRTCMFTTYDEKVNKSQAKVGIFMAKTYVPDTNVLIQAPYALQCFEENHLVLPLVVLEELDGLYQLGPDGQTLHPALYENEFLLLRADASRNKTHLGCIRHGRAVPLLYADAAPYGVRPRNAGQYFLQEALMRPADEAPLVIIKGQAGTAKTFYSLAVGLEKIVNHPTREYRRILICRPNAQFDTDIGFLPGDEQKKIAPLLRPIRDNLEQLVDGNEDLRYENEQELAERIDEIFDRQIIQAEALNFIRGRSLEKTYLIIDEAQNMTPNQVKGIITRAGKGTKIILLGDPNQIDRPFLDERTNGLMYAAEKMKESPLCWQVTMLPGECERSELALDAILRLS